MNTTNLPCIIAHVSNLFSCQRSFDEEVDIFSVRFSDKRNDTTSKSSEKVEVLMKSPIMCVNLLSFALVFSLAGCVNHGNLAGDNNDDKVDGSVFSSDSSKDKKDFNLDKEHAPGELIVKFKPVSSRSSSQQASAAHVREDLLVQEALSPFNGKTLHTFKISGAHLISFADTKKQGSGNISQSGSSAKDNDNDSDRLLEIARQLDQMPNVEYVEANSFIKGYSQIPNDPDYQSLYNLPIISAPEAWNITTGSRDVLVAIIDTGVHYMHPDLKDNYWFNPGEMGLDEHGNDKSSNGIDDDGNGFIDDFRGWDFVNNDNDPMDDNGHGTHIAGIIGATGNNGIGVVGVNWQVSMVGIKVLGANNGGYVSNIVKAIEYASSLGATVTNNSYGSVGGYSKTMKAAIEQANDADVLFVTAAGNDSFSNDMLPNFPQNYDVPNIITVAATNKSDYLSRFSNYGANTVHVAAPGDAILSTLNGTVLNIYGKMSGTSMAAPHVVGLIALIKSVHPQLTGIEIKERIMRNVDRVGDAQTKTISGGRINAYKALVDDSTPPAQVTGLKLLKQTTTSITISWQEAGDDGTLGQASRYEIRLSDIPITTDDEWEAAELIESDISQGSNQTLETTIAGLDSGSKGTIAIRAFDKVGNVSPISDSLAFDLAEPPVPSRPPSFCGQFGSLRQSFDRIRTEILCTQLQDNYIANVEQRFRSTDKESCCDCFFPGTICPLGKKLIERSRCEMMNEDFRQRFEDAIENGVSVMYCPQPDSKDLISCCV